MRLQLSQRAHAEDRNPRLVGSGYLEQGCPNPALGGPSTRFAPDPPSPKSRTPRGLRHDRRSASIRPNSQREIFAHGRGCRLAVQDEQRARVWLSTGDFLLPVVHAQQERKGSSRTTTPTCHARSRRARVAARDPADSMNNLNARQHRSRVRLDRNRDSAVSSGVSKMTVGYHWGKCSEIRAVASGRVLSRYVSLQTMGLGQAQ